MARAPAPWLASLLSLTLPGAGQLYSGKAMRGAGFFAGIVLVLLLAAYLLVVLISSFGMVLDVVLTLGFVVFAAVDAWRLAAR